MVISRVWAMPNKNTFDILPIKNLLCRYLQDVRQKGVVVDPFANKSLWGTLRNDLNPDFDTQYHMDALKFLETLGSETADVVLYDPPFSIHQAVECYKSFGKDKLTTNVSSMRYWKLCKDNVARILKPHGIAICCGWTSQGMGKGRNFDMMEILLVAHGGSKNDTIVTVERKLPQCYVQQNIFDDLDGLVVENGR